MINNDDVRGRKVLIKSDADFNQNDINTHENEKFHFDDDDYDDCREYQDDDLW